ncbi:hypothetical protein DI09_79p80 [Mitosporidium daphniae]|uniref:Uncharacterized protein n=1 Tax=Mitosporidium daphniae TaxID=1485682 RepID=A0A098VMU4_9MICR|nr:uncharacterized protein DI09_79p80 [Mitosporidium daphniae]KGG50285.1 hypothetical protein DI09_79p80 [Mitosporidium daphniae]|eukprot:XP_013236729.1 uncharacterized protein DI09_79p80 [Mitosporidium daphniae]
MDSFQLGIWSAESPSSYNVFSSLDADDCQRYVDTASSQIPITSAQHMDFEACLIQDGFEHTEIIPADRRHSPKAFFENINSPTLFSSIFPVACTGKKRASTSFFEMLSNPCLFSS